MPKWLNGILTLVFNKWGVTAILLGACLAFIMLVVNSKLDTVVAQGSAVVTAQVATTTEIHEFRLEHERQDQQRDRVYQQMLHYAQLQCLHTANDWTERQGCLQ